MPIFGQVDFFFASLMLSLLFILLIIFGRKDEEH